ncbi:hypothetical protein D3C71_1423830 [compost metagenome]
MAQTVRQEWRGKPLFHHGFFADTAHQFVAFKQFGDALVHLHMVIGVTHTGFDGFHQRQLLVIKIFNQLGEIAAALASISTSQIGRIAVIFRTSIDQKAQHFSRRLVIQRGVMQYRRMLIQRNDIVVRHIGIAMACRREISQVDIKLTHA